MATDGTDQGGEGGTFKKWHGKIWAYPRAGPGQRPGEEGTQAQETGCSSGSGTCLEEGDNSEPKGGTSIARRGGRVEVAPTRLEDGAQDLARTAPSDKTRASEMDQTKAVSNGWGPGRGERGVAKTRASSSGSGLEEGSSRWVGWERGLGQGVSIGWQGPGPESPLQR